MYVQKVDRYERQNFGANQYTRAQTSSQYNALVTTLHNGNFVLKLH